MSDEFTHTLHKDVACLVGADSALIYRRVAYWIEGEEQSGQHLKRGHSFSKINVPSLVRKFPWLSDRQVRKCLKRLCDAELLSRAEDDEGKPLRLGRNKNDASGWYSKTAKSLGLPNGDAGLPNGEMGVTEWEDGGDQTVTSIKINTPSNYPLNTPSSLASPRGNLKPDLPSKEFLDAVMGRWNSMASLHGFQMVHRMTQPRIRYVRDRLAECGGNGMGLMAVIDRVPLMGGWRGGGKRDHITFDWVHGPPKHLKPDRFLEAQEYNPDTDKPKAQHDRPNNPNAKPTQAQIIAERRERRAALLAERRGEERPLDGTEPMDERGGHKIQQRINQG